MLLVEIEYVDDGEREMIDFDPSITGQEIFYWKTLKCSGSSINKVNDGKIGNDGHCILCDVSFKTCGYKTIVPCSHSRVCSKCALRMRWFKGLRKEKKSVPLCPFCKKSWEEVVFASYWYTESWPEIFSNPLEYDSELVYIFLIVKQCHFLIE